MGKKKSVKYNAPEYASTSYDTGGLFGSSTTDKSGTTYNPSSWMTNTMNTTGNSINTTLQNMLSNDYSNDANFQAYQNQLNKTAKQNYDTSVLSSLADRGLMRSSGLQAATNSFADTLADNTTDLYDSYYNRQANNLSSLLNTSNALYNYITGVNSGSQTNTNNLNNFNLTNAGKDLEAQKTNASSNSGLWSTLANVAGSLGNTALSTGLAAATGGTGTALSGGSSILKGIA